MRCIRCFVLAVIGTAILAAETIHLKTRELDPLPDRTAYQASPLKRRTPGNSHYLVQFERQVNAETFRQLRERGITVTGYLPRTALMIAAPDDFSLDGMPVRWVGRLESHDKISPLVVTRTAAARGQRVYVVEFHSDVDMQEARALVKEHGLRLVENADAGAHRLLVSGPFGSLSRLASWDEVAYIFSASPELIAHVPVRACAGAVVQETTVAQYSGPGYPWPATNGLTLAYVFSRLTEKIPSASAQSEMLRAFNEWSKAANVNFTAGTNAQASRTMNILFARGPHGDAYPFDGPGGVLAHTFYPAPANPEPIAGDMHLDDDERWQVGANTDLFSAVLHETGHALGLMHTDNPADVMYPYYRLQTHLGAGDIAVVQAMYGTRDGSAPAQPPAPPSLPLFLTIENSADTTTTTAPSISFSGTASGGTGRMAYQHRVDGRRDRFGELEHPCRASQHRWKPDHDHRDRRGERHGVAAAIGDAAATAYGGATHEPSAANETDDTDDTNEPGTNTGSGRAHNPSHPGVAHAATAPFTGRQDTTLAPHYLSRVQHHCDVGERHLSPGARGGQCRSYLGHLENFNWDLRPRNWNDELGSREHSAPLRQQRGHHPGI